jgi:hypothetical protein
VNRIMLGEGGRGAGLVDNSHSNLPLLTFHSLVQRYAYKQHHVFRGYCKPLCLQLAAVWPDSNKAGIINSVLKSLHLYVTPFSLVDINLSEEHSASVSVVP